MAATLPRAFPIFPLSEVLLVPGAFLPLHIFEQRYREMVADAMLGDRMIAIALPLPGHTTDEEDAPPVHAICGLGRIVQHRPYADGRCDIVLAGLTRMEIEREIASAKPYRTVTGTPVHEVLTVDESLIARAHALLDRIHGLSEEERAQAGELPLARVVDLVALRLPIPVIERHALHAIPDVRDRVAAVEAALDRLAGRVFPLEFGDADPRLN